MQRVFVGDVQGCAVELEAVVARARAAFGDRFELWSVGDVVNRGPASLRVLRCLRALADAGRARVVLGNHELSLLRTAFGRRPRAPDDTFDDVLAARDADAWLDWIRTWPVVEADRLGRRRFAMVHAALGPGWGLEGALRRARRIEARLRASRREAERLLAADPRRDEDAAALARMTRCRSADGRGRWSSEEPRRPEDAWHRRWAARRHGYAIVYGHWAMQGLHVARDLRGLDTGCVYHGVRGDRFLTAWVPDPADPNPFRARDDRFWRVPARGRYWRGAAGDDAGRGRRR